jgi:Cdc6-like AAA superfamily ATPase
MGIKRGEREGITLVEGPPGTGKTDVVVEMIRRLSKDKENKIVVVT